MKSLTFTIHSQIIGGKNQMQIDPRSGRHYPNKKFAFWRDRWHEDFAPVRQAATLLGLDLAALAR